MESIRTPLAHRARREGTHAIFGAEIANIMASDETRKTSERLQELNNFNKEKQSYKSKKLPHFSFKEGQEPQRVRLFRNEVPMKVRTHNAILERKDTHSLDYSCESLWQIISATRSQESVCQELWSCSWYQRCYSWNDSIGCHLGKCSWIYAGRTPLTRTIGLLGSVR
jgi:hypothetical protein